MLLDAALSPALPLGWAYEEITCEGGIGSGFYWNTLSGAAQHEHPNLSFVTGIATRLNRMLLDASRESKAMAGPQTPAS